MKLALPVSPKWLARRMLAVRLSPVEFSRIADSNVWWWPWCLDDETQEVVCHVSVAPFLMRMKGFAGFESIAAKRFVRSRLLETRAASRDIDLVDRPSSYPWERCLSKAWDDRAFQRCGMDRLWARMFGTFETGGSILGDDVGLGKTIQAIGVVSRAISEKKVSASRGVLVSTLVAMKSQWAEEFRRFLPPSIRDKIEIVLVDGGREEREARMNRRAAIHIVNHEMFRLPQYAEAVDRLLARKRVVVFDETYVIKNPKTSLWAAIRAARAKVGPVVLFNATPIENGIGDMMAQVSIVDRDVFGNLDAADSRYVVRDQYNKQRGASNVPEYRVRVGAVHFRRTAARCGVQLPDVVAEVRRVAMSPEQTDAYAAAVGEYLEGDTRGALARSRLARIERRAFAESLSDLGSSSAKMDDIVSLLKGELSGEKAVLFTHLSTIAKSAYLRLKRAGIPSLLVTGDTPNTERTESRRRFSAPEFGIRAIVVTEAMDRGANLQAASIVVNLTPPWTPGRLRQRVGRVRRIGQERSRVLVLNYVAVPARKYRSVDEFKLGIVSGKREIVDRVFGDDGIDEIGSRVHSALAEYLRGGSIAPRNKRQHLRPSPEKRIPA